MSVHYSCVDIVLAQLRDVEAGLWLGMSAWDTHWLWEDNSNISYTNWLPGEPSNVRRSYYDLFSATLQQFQTLSQ